MVVFSKTLDKVFSKTLELLKSFDKLGLIVMRFIKKEYQIYILDRKAIFLVFFT